MRSHRCLRIVIVLLYFISCSEAEFQAFWINDEGFHPANSSLLLSLITEAAVIDEACTNLESTEEKLFLSVIDVVNGTISEKLLFYCGSTKLPLKTILRKYINGFERNRPRNWYKDDVVNMNCTDAYGRRIPLPPGVLQCYTYQTSKIVDIKDYGPVFETSFESGYDLTKIKNFPKNKRCALAFNFDLNFDVSKQGSDIIEDGKCEISIAFQEVQYLCCCYSDGSKCRNTIHNTKLVCPRVQANETLSIDNPLSLNQSIGDLSSIDASEMFMSSTDTYCYAELYLLRNNREETAEVAIRYSPIEASWCNITFKDMPYEGCKRRNRLCLHDTRPEEYYCCRFGKKSWTQNQVLSTHQIWARFLYQEIKSVKFAKTKNCLHPHPASDYCFVYYYLPTRTYVNFKHGNFRISDHYIKSYDDFIQMPLEANDTSDIFFFHGRPRYDVLAENSCCRNGNNTRCALNVYTPFWYRITLLMIKCKTLDNDEFQCDDIFQNHHLLPHADLQEENYKYSCLTADGSIKPSWDAFCHESVHYHASTPENYTTLLGTVNFKSVRNDFGHEDDVEMSELADMVYYCDVKTDGVDMEERWCVCKTTLEEPCNTGKFVENRHLISQQPVVSLAKPENQNYCTLKSAQGSVSCPGLREDQTPQQCYFVMHENLTKTNIGCLQDPGLSHNVKSVQFKNWQQYQVCQNMDHYKKKGFYCTIIDSNNFGRLEESPMITCCCEANYCDDAAEWVQKHSTWKRIKD